jgi:hypothetical protein
MKGAGWAASALSLDAAACAMWTGGSLRPALLLHLAASVVGLGAVRSLTPDRMAGRWRETLPLAAGLTLFVPVAGLVGLVFGFLRPLGRQRPPVPAPAVRRCRLPVPAPVDDPVDGPANADLRSLAATRRLSVFEAVPILRDALAGDTDEERLLAHALLVARERAAAGRLERCERALRSHPSGVAYLRAAQACGDLAESGLVDGDVRLRTLDEALAHAAAGLARTPADGRLQLVRGRLSLARGNAMDAMSSLRAAVAHGLPDGLVAPHLWRARLALRGRTADSV